MPTFLYFETENIAKLEKAKIKDGTVTIDNNLFLIDTTKPIMLRKRFGGFDPMFIVKWSDVMPAHSVRAQRLRPIRRDEGYGRPRRRFG